MQIGRSVSALHQLDRLGQQLGLVGQRDAHVDVEHVGAALDLRLDVALDRGQVAGAQLLLEDPAAGRVDPLADQAEPPAVADHDLLGGRPEDGLEGLSRHAGTFARRWVIRALARLTLAEASAA